MPSTGVYPQYDPLEPPPLTSSCHVRFICLSDTHSTQPAVPDGDVLLHAGDLTTLGDLEDVRRQIEWIKSLPHPIKIVIAGNHDFVLDNKTGWYDRRGKGIQERYKVNFSSPDEARRVVDEALDHDNGKLYYLENESIEVSVKRDGVSHKKWKVWGSPSSPEFEDWAWNYHRGEEAKQVHAAIPSDTDILITHTPPHKLGGLDVIHNGTSVGCEELTRKVQEGEVRPRLWCFGHIHEARGTHIHRYPSATAADHQGSSSSSSTATAVSSPDDTILVNAAMVDYDVEEWEQRKRFTYNIVAQPVIVDLEV